LSYVQKDKYSGYNGEQTYPLLPLSDIAPSERGIANHMILPVSNDILIVLMSNFCVYGIYEF